METFKLQAYIGADGVLKVELPTGLSQRDVEVVVVLNTLATPPALESWQDFVNRMYGALADDPIERPPQLST